MARFVDVQSPTKAGAKAAALAALNALVTSGEIGSGQRTISSTAANALIDQLAAPTASQVVAVTIFGGVIKDSSGNGANVSAGVGINCQLV